MADWDVLRESESQAASEYVLSEAREGDVFALNTLIAKKDHKPVCELLTQLAEGQLSDMHFSAQVSLIRASARLAHLCRNSFGGRC